MTLLPPTEDVTVTVTGPDIRRSLTVPKGTLLLDALRNNHIFLEAACGGQGICQKCAVNISGQLLPACQTKITEDLSVYLPQTNELSSAPLQPPVISPINKPASPLYKKWGIAVDLGTTTICMTLISRDRDSPPSQLTRRNPQTAWGADVISRIGYAVNNGSALLTQSIRAALNEMIRQLAAGQAIRPAAIDGAVITGNTAMLYLLTGQNPASLATAPFAADRLFGETVPARSLGLNIDPDAPVYLPGCISAFIGADTVTAILAAGLPHPDKTILLADIGTNGEIVLSHQNRLSCTSAAAGPAFEGFGLSCGSYGRPGAIDRVWHEDRRIRYSTIAHAPARSICGSGVIDALAVMSSLALIDETGYREKPLSLSADVAITLADIRAVQLAKGAIRAGIETLLETSGVSSEQVRDFLIAGSFGSHLNPDNAAAIGLFPPQLLPAVRIIGNSAHHGAAMLLQNQKLIPESETAARHAQVIRLNSQPLFEKYFIEYLNF